MTTSQPQPAAQQPTAPQRPAWMATQRPRQPPSQTVVLPRGTYQLLIAGAIAGMAALVIGFVITLGTIVSQQVAQQTTGFRAPTATEVKLLEVTQAHSLTPCGLEANQVQGDYEVTCAPSK